MLLDVVTAMAVCIVDVDSEHTPTIQYGNMCVMTVLDVLIRIAMTHECALLCSFAAGIASNRSSTSASRRTETAAVVHIALN